MALLDWCSRPTIPKPKLDLSFCAVPTSRQGVTIDVVEGPRHQLVISNGVFMHGGICIDRNGLRKTEAPRQNGFGIQSETDYGANGTNGLPRAVSGIFGDNAITRAIERGFGRPTGGGSGDSSDSDWMSTATTPIQRQSTANGFGHRDSARAGSISMMPDWPKGIFPFLRESLGGAGAPTRTGSAATGADVAERRASMRESFVGKSRVRLENLVKIKDCSILGKGVSGTVWKVQDKASKRILALKEMTLSVNNADDVEKSQLMVQEMTVMELLEHPNVVACLGVFFEETKDLGNTFKIVMEFMDAGSLLDLLRAAPSNTIPVPVLGAIGKQVTEGLMYLHEKIRVIHRDIKPGNILLNRRGRVKIADFGVCSPREARPSTAVTWVGTVTYMSPERITCRNYSFNCDMWSLGLLMLEAATGRYPFLPEDMADKRKLEFWDLFEFINSSTNIGAKMPAGTDENFRSFVEFVLQKDPATRPSSGDALRHPFLSAVHDESLTVVRWIPSALRDTRAADAARISQALEGLSIPSPTLAAALAADAAGTASVAWPSPKSSARR